MAPGVVEKEVGRGAAEFEHVDALAFEVARDGLACRRRQVDRAGLAFVAAAGAGAAVDDDVAVGQVQVRDLELADLGRLEARGEELEDRAVAASLRRPLDELPDRGRGDEPAHNGLVDLGIVDALGEVGGDRPLADEELSEAADRAELARDGRGTHALGAGVVDEAADVVAVELAGVGHLGELGELPEIGLVGGDGLARAASRRKGVSVGQDHIGEGFVGACRHFCLTSRGTPRRSAVGVRSASSPSTLASSWAK
ncbi:hypothetical protein D3C72_1349980 [compost metagenome]